ncbi:MAG: hypothetical protein FD180_266 [Planctomycetota bacterium]|nr:MAG: hypothetical protein FD180_266 [Planctomycetota bacterium]
MHDAAHMRRMNRFRRVPDYFERAAKRYLDSRERAPFEKLHRDVETPREHAEFVDRRDIRMLEGSDDLRLATETRFVLRGSSRHPLQRDDAPQRRLPRAPDFSHAALAERGDEDELAEAALGVAHRGLNFRRKVRVRGGGELGAALEKGLKGLGPHPALRPHRLREPALGRFAQNRGDLFGREQILPKRRLEDGQVVRGGIAGRRRHCGREILRAAGNRLKLSPRPLPSATQTSGPPRRRPPRSRGTRTEASEARIAARRLSGSGPGEPCRASG